MKKLFAIGLCIAVLLAFFAFPGMSFAEKKIIVGGKNYTEQYLLPQLGAILLEAQGFDVTVKTGVATTVLRQALLNDLVDMYFEYTGSAYSIFFKQEDPDIMRDPVRIYNYCKETDLENEIVWLDRFEFNNTYTLMLRKEDTEKLNIHSISELAVYVNKNPNALIFAMSAEDWERPDAFRGVMKTYSFKVPPGKVKKMGSGLVYMAMKQKKVDCAIGFSTDGRIAAFDFLNLDDDKNFFPVYNPTPVIRKEVLEKYPEIADILKPLTDTVTTKEMQGMNAAVAIDHKPDREVALDYLKKKGLIQ